MNKIGINIFNHFDFEPNTPHNRGAFFRRMLEQIWGTSKHKEARFQVISEYEITYSDLEAAIWNTLLDFFGERGMAQTSMWLIKNLYDDGKQAGVIRCNNKSVQKILAGLGFVTRFGDNRVTIKILKVSGTIKGLK